MLNPTKTTKKIVSKLKNKKAAESIFCLLWVGKEGYKCIRPWTRPEIQKKLSEKASICKSSKEPISPFEKFKKGSKKT